MRQDGRVSTTDRVFATLRDDIVSGRLPAGGTRSIYALAEDLGVSRTPVRDAVLRLADVGLVTIERNRGVRIRGITGHDIRNVYELRMMIEIPAAAIAAGVGATLRSTLDEQLGAMHRALDRDDAEAFLRHDRALHDVILSVMGNERVMREIANLRDATQSMGALTLNRSRPLAQIAREHQPIVDAIISEDPAAARAAMCEHLVATARALLSQFESEPPADGWPKDFLRHLGVAYA